jgi:hypothetical protein
MNKNAGRWRRITLDIGTRFFVALWEHTLDRLQFTDARYPERIGPSRSPEVVRQKAQEIYYQWTALRVKSSEGVPARTHATRNQVVAQPCVAIDHALDFFCRVVTLRPFHGFWVMQPLWPIVGHPPSVRLITSMGFGYDGPEVSSPNGPMDDEWGWLGVPPCGHHLMSGTRRGLQTATNMNA